MGRLEPDQCGNHIIEAGEDCDGAGIGENACNDACRVACTADSTCPDGWGCGVDKLCRQPSGELAPLGDAVTLPIGDLRFADFDGDGRSDLLASQGSSAAIAYLDSAGLLPGTTTLSVEPIDELPDLPAIGDVDGDGRADLVLRQGEGIGVLRGQRDRTLLTTPFKRALADADTELFAFDIDPRGQAPGAELIGVRDDGIYLLSTADLATPVPTKMYTLPTGVPKHIVFQQVINPNLSPGIDIVVAVDGDQFVTVYEPFVVGTNFEDAPIRPPIVVNLPADAIVTGPAIPVHLKTVLVQTIPDLLISGSSGGVHKEYVAFNSQNLGFHSQPLTAALTTFDGGSSELVRSVDGVPYSGDVLATLNINGDAFIDFVTPDGLQVSQCPTDGSACLSYDAATLTVVAPYYATWVYPDVPSGWTGAKVLVGASFPTGDFVTYSEDPGLTLWKSLAPFRVNTTSPIQHVDFGDLNGDTARDLVFSQRSTRATADDPELESLHVAFGDPFGLPTTPVDLGDVGDVASLFTARVPAPGAPFAPPLASIYARTSAGDYYLFSGSTDKAIQSPLELGEICESPVPAGVPKSFALGAFDDEPGDDIAVLYRDEHADGSISWELWSIPNSALVSDEVCSALSGPVDLGESSEESLRVETLDVDGDGLDELVILPEGASYFYLARAGMAGWELTNIQLPAPTYGMTKLALTDHGPLDLAFWTQDEVLVIWNQEDGTLDPTTAGHVTIRGSTCADEPDRPVGRPNGVAAVHFYPTATRDLVVVTEDDTLVVSVNPTTHELAIGGCETATFSGGATAVLSADFDADGVEDLLLARVGGTRIFAGVPVIR